MAGPPLFSILNEDGSCEDAHRGLLSDDEVRHALDSMILNRILDRRLLMLQRQGRLGFWMTSRGEEATILGAAAALLPDDPIFLSYRELGCLLWRRIPLPLIFNQLIGNSRDLCLGRQMPIHYCYKEWAIPSVSSPVGTQLPHACGFGYAAKLRNTGQVSLAFCGEGTASEGDFHTALNFAGVFSTPTIFVIRNNGYAISTPESVQTAAESLAARAEGYGMPGYQVDGNDLLAVVKVLGEAVENARSGGGPTLVEAMTYRMGAHSTADDPSAYRSDDETAAWNRLDPYERLKRHGCWRGVWSDEEDATVQTSWDERVTSTLAECERHPPPRVESLFEGVLETVSPQLEAQRDAYLADHRRRQRDEFEVP
ncbi:MAG: thiamine pyrophosphate-dependent dehydrogenase E1 component subunit alpha [bacterium]|nr:thiamine pyrophosphate-dependent dehydrogenase E1 component subunit alpha [bacterium]MCP5071100.1 thiamine pyrophosphate-dependent dehydrogenase E1 component subunit alpha [bacterium]